MRSGSARVLAAALFALVLVPAEPAPGSEAPAGPARFASGRILVRFREGAPPAQREQARRRSRARSASRIAGAGVEVLTVAAGSEKTGLESLRRDPAVESADLDWRRKGFDHVPGETPWGVRAVNAPDVWSTVTGAEVVVAVVDSGVDLSHSDLINAIAQNAGEVGTDGAGRDRRTNGVDDDGNGRIDDWRGWDFAANDANPLDVVGHGTGVAGVIAAAHDGVGLTGVAHGAKVLPVRVLGDDGYGEDSDIIAGITYAADAGAKVINMSLGAPFFSEAVRAAVDYAAGRGSLVVAAAGNGPSPAPVVNYPAGFAGVLSVGATDSAGQPASFSQTGKVDVAAPGAGIPLPRMGGGTQVADGTSFAAPHVAGVAALLAQKYPLATGRRLRHLVIATATDTAAPGNDVRTGAGIVNARAAVFNTDNLMSVTAVPRVVAGNGVTTAALTVAVSGPDGLPSGAEQHVTFAGTNASPSSTDVTTGGDGAASVQVSSQGSPGSTGRIEVTWLEGPLTQAFDLTVTGADDDLPGVPIATPVTSRTETVGPGVDRDVVKVVACPGERVKVELRSADTAHWLVLAAYETGSVFDTEPLTAAASPPFPAVLEVTVPSSGVLYFSAEAWDGLTGAPPSRAVAYSLTIRREPRATASLSHTHISPNGDGAHDTTTVSVRALATAPMSLKILSPGGAQLESRDFGTVPAGETRSFAWNGKRTDGSRLPDGYYKVQVDWNGACAWRWSAAVAVDAAKPLVWGVNDTDPFYPVTDGYKDATRIWFELNEGAEVVLRVHPWGSGRAVRTLRGWKPRGISFIEWNGRDDAGRIVPAGGYEYQFWLTDYARNTHLPATGKYTVNVSHKRLVGKRVTLQRSAAQTHTYGYYDVPRCGNPRLSNSNRYYGGVLMATGDCNGTLGDETPVLIYRFTVPSATVYYSMQVVTSGGSNAWETQRDAGQLAGSLTNWSRSRLEPAGSTGFVWGTGFTWHGYGWNPARAYVSSSRTVEVRLDLLDCCNDPSEDFDLATVQLQLTYAVLQ